MMEQVRRELVHLVLGKSLSTLMGLIVLLLMWRRVAPAAYGQYLSIVAAAEILSLVSAMGLSTVAQRHLPVWMAHAANGWQALNRILQVLCLRLVLAAFFLAGFMALASTWDGPWASFYSIVNQPLTLALIMATVLSRSLEEFQVVLFMQAWLQGLTLTAHLFRLVALFHLAPGDWVDFSWLLQLELAIASLALAVGLWATGMRAIRVRHLDDSLESERPMTWWAAWRNSLGFWMTQCLGLAWSIHTLRLLLQSVAGPTAVAVQGVAQAMVDSLRQATPLVWATGWLRAAMLRLHAAQPDSERALELASAVHRLSWFMLWPVVAAWCVEPAGWLRWMGGSEMFAKAQDLAQLPGVPAITGLLAVTALLAPLQNRHLLISLWAYVQQRPEWGVLASVAAVVPVATFGWMWSLVGLWSVPIVMLSAELLWVGIAGWAWRFDRRPLEHPWRSIQVPFVALVSAGLVSLLLNGTTNPDSYLRLVFPLLASAGAVGALAWFKTLWTNEERAVLKNCIPEAAWAWRAPWKSEPSR